MFLEDGTDLDDYVSPPQPWRPGDVIYAGGLPAYRITEVIPLAEADPYDGIWKVEPLM